SYIPPPPHPPPPLSPPAALRTPPPAEGAAPAPPEGAPPPPPEGAPPPPPGQSAPAQGQPQAQQGAERTPPRLSFTSGEVSFWREIGRAHLSTPLTDQSPIPSSP